MQRRHDNGEQLDGQTLKVGECAAAGAGAANTALACNEEQTDGVGGLLGVGGYPPSPPPHHTHTPTPPPLPCKTSCVEHLLPPTQWHYCPYCSCWSLLLMLVKRCKASASAGVDLLNTSANPPLTCPVFLLLPPHFPLLSHRLSAARQQQWPSPSNSQQPPPAISSSSNRSAADSSRRRRQLQQKAQDQHLAEEAVVATAQLVRLGTTWRMLATSRSRRGLKIFLRCLRLAA
jgi:hypothetical protein